MDASRWRMGVVASIALASCLGCTVTEEVVPPMEAAELKKKGIQFKESPKVKPTPEILSDFGDVRAADRDFVRAADLYRRALELDKRHVPAHLGLARLHSVQNRPDRAVEALETAIAEGVKNPEVYYELAVAHARNDNHEPAMSAIEKALAKAPQEQRYLLTQASLLVMAGQPDRGHEVLCRFLTPADAHYRIAAILRERGDQAGSVERLRRALAEDPRHPEAAALLSQLTGEVAHGRAVGGPNSTKG